MTNTFMRLDNLILKNYRCFEEFTIDFNKTLTVIVAENGIGKTAILDAISIALGPFLGGFDSGVSKGFRHTDARLDIRKGIHIQIENASRRMEAKYPITLEGAGVINDRPMPWSRELTGKKTNTTFGKAKCLSEYAKNLQQQVRNGEVVTLPIIAYYGTGRLWKKTKIKYKSSVESHSRLFGYHDALNPDSNFNAFEKWFIQTNLAENFAELRKIQKLTGKGLSPSIQDNNTEVDIPTSYSNELRHIREAINSCIAISGFQWLEYDPEWDELVVRVTSESSALERYIPVARLSDGVKAMLSLAADIAYRCVKLNPDLNAPTKETQGIVLIDEVDMHLHPKWQQTVLKDLTETFPNIQFIVTTHSPQVLTTVSADCIRLLQTETDEVSGKSNIVTRHASTQTLGVASSDVLSSIMAIDPVPDVPEARKLHRYHELIQQNQHETDDGVTLRSKLIAHFGAGHSVILECDRLIRLQAMKSKLPTRK